MKKIISNVFTLAMIANLKIKNELSVMPVTAQQAREFIMSEGAESSVGHEQTAQLMSNELGIEVPFNRRSDRLNPGDQVLVGQYTGPRLPEGQVNLPEGETLTWVLVEIK